MNSFVWLFFKAEIYKPLLLLLYFNALDLRESRGGHPGLPVPNSPYDLCGRKATLSLNRTAVIYVSRFGLALRR